VRVFAAVRAGATIAQAARSLGLTTAFARELLDEEQYRQGLNAAAVPKVPNAPLRRAAQDQVLFGERTYSQIARDGGWASPSDVRRLLGMQETSDTRAADRVYAGGLVETITAEAAGRLARALGYAPVEADSPDAAPYGRLRP
jgi:hypothetical protein